MSYDRGEWTRLCRPEGVAGGFAHPMFSLVAPRTKEMDIFPHLQTILGH